MGFSQCNLGEPWRVAMNADGTARAKDFPQMEIVFADAQPCFGEQEPRLGIERASHQF